jgi:hypothetical protein
VANECFLPFIVRHGTKAQLVSRGSLFPGELGWTTDENLVYVGDGSGYYMIGRAVMTTLDPVGNGVSGQIHVNTTTSGIFVSNGSGWMSVGASHLASLEGTLDDIADGTNYQRVAASEVSAQGYILQINDGTHIVTAETARDHIDDATRHRQINDAGSASTDLWSAQKIMDQLGSTVRNVSWQDPVKDKDLCVPPGSPANLDRYVVCPTASGGWTEHSNAIAEYLTASGGWVYNAPSEGWTTWVEDEDRLYLYTGTAWGPISSVTYHDYLAGLSGNGPQFYHLNLAEFNALTANRTSTVQHIVGPMVSGMQTSIAVTYHEDTGLIDFIVSVPHAATTGMTANDHHNQSHGLVGGDHTVTTVSGHVLRAISAGAVEMGPITSEMLPTIQHGSLAGIGPDDHHNRLHNVLGLGSLDHSWGSLTNNTILGVTATASGVIWIDSLNGGSF